MDGYYANGHIINRGSNEIAIVTASHLNEQQFQVLVNYIVKLLNDDNDRQEFTPEKYPMLFVKCTCCGTKHKIER